MTMFRPSAGLPNVKLLRTSVHSNMQVSARDPILISRSLLAACSRSKKGVAEIANSRGLGRGREHWQFLTRFPAIQSQARLFSTTSTRNSASASPGPAQAPSRLERRRRPWALVLSFCLGGVASLFALRSSQSSQQESLPTGSGGTAPSVYGNVTDFQSAIHELQEAFPEEDRVTADPEDLHDHGFSVNDYHPGKGTLFQVILYFKNAEENASWILKARSTASSYIPSLRRTW